MSNLLATFQSSSNALDALERALTVVQSNVSNASTPGYAAQKLELVAEPLDLSRGLLGGLAAGKIISSRDQYADSAVQLQLQTLGFYSAQSQGTGAIQSLFDASGTSGVPNALNNLLSAFSTWSASPSDTTARQQVISSASALADSVQGLSRSLTSTGQQLSSEIGSTTDQINSIAAQIQQYNLQRVHYQQTDAGADAQLHTALENLSQLVNYTAVTQADGTVTVLAGGGTPLVLGSQLNKLSASDYVDAQPAPANPAAQPTTHILDATGNDVTGQISGGQLGGLLDAKNRVLAGIIGDGQQAGSLNVFAKTLADTVNGILQSGTVSSQTGAAAGAPLFSYNASDATLASGSLAVNASITPDQLAAADASGNANGNASKLATLGSASATQGLISGQNLVNWFAGIAAHAGSEHQSAQSSEQLQTQLVSQARTTRDQISGVSLDDQAAQLLELQRGYQAVSRVLNVVNSLVDSILSLIPQA